MRCNCVFWRTIEAISLVDGVKTTGNGGSTSAWTD